MSNVMEKAFLGAGFKPLKPRKARPAKVNKCRKCGADMTIIENTNVMICTGDIEVKDATGIVTSTVPCTNRVIFTK